MGAELIEQFLNYLSVEKGLRAKTLEAYKRDLQDWLLFAQAKNREITSESIDNVLGLFFIHMHDTALSARSMARKSSAIKGFYRFLQREKIIDFDPTSMLDRPKIGKSLPKVLSQTEIEKILSVPDSSTPLGLRDKAILEVLYATGMRESELIGLTIGSINMLAEFVSIMGKGGRERVVPIGKPAVEAVNEYLKNGRNKLLKNISERALFVNIYGGRISRMGIWKLIRKYALTAGIERDVSPHVFRHSCATHMLEGGASIIAVQEMLGHADVSTTQIYTHLTGKDLKNVHKKAHPRG